MAENEEIPVDPPKTTKIEHGKKHEPTGKKYLQGVE